MNSLKIYFKNMNFNLLGVGSGWLILSYMIMGNPSIENKFPGIITLILGIIAIILGAKNKTQRKNDKITSIFSIILAIIITIYSTLFIIYFLAGFINI